MDSFADFDDLGVHELKELFDGLVAEERQVASGELPSCSYGAAHPAREG